MISHTVRTYIMSESACFRKSADQFGAFGNMTGGYPLRTPHGIWKSSEALYQAARFIDHPEIQEDIRNASNGFTAKLVAKANLDKTRGDWIDVRDEVMIAVVVDKYLAYSIQFDVLFAQTEKKVIVEVSTKDNYWGAQPDYSIDVACGANVLGQIWKGIRDETFDVNRPRPHFFASERLMEKFE